MRTTVEEGVPARRLWSQFDGLGGRKDAPEWFDHPAAAMYVNADDPALLSDQLELLQKLMRLERLATRLPLTMSYEELALYTGRTTISTLVRGLYGEFLHNTRRDLRISKPPNTEPRRDSTVHLVWSADYTGVARYWQASNGVEMSYSSSLQGLMALILDDLRSALQGLRIRYRLQRAHPALECARVFEGGFRWRRRQGEAAIPTEAVRILFARCGHVAAARRKTWAPMGPRSDPRDFWLAGILTCDLPALGFAHLRGSETTEGVCSWSAASPRLDPRITHVVACTDPSGKGSTYRVRRSDSAAGARVTLEPLPPRRVVVRGEGSDPSFIALRTNVLDLAIEQVWARLA